MKPRRSLFILFLIAGLLLANTPLAWAGTDAWTIDTSPNQGTNQYNELRAVSVTPGTSVAEGGTVWAVGFYKNGSNIWQTLILTYTVPD